MKGEMDPRTGMYYRLYVCAGIWNQESGRNLADHILSSTTTGLVMLGTSRTKMLLKIVI